MRHNASYAVHIRAPGRTHNRIKAKVMRTRHEHTGDVLRLVLDFCSGGALHVDRSHAAEYYVTYSASCA